MNRNAMKFGAHYLPTYIPDLDGPLPVFYQNMFAQMEEIDRLGYDQIWVTEHHFTMYGGTLPHPPTFLAAIARTTQQVRLGVAVSVLALHNPIDVAESYAMVDVISNGRLEFGIGKGSEAHEYKKAGVDQKQSASHMVESMKIIRQAWSDEPVKVSGEFFQFDNVPVFPKPAQRPHPPIWVGCSRSEESFLWAGENGFHLMTLPYLYREPGVLPGFVKSYRRALAHAGHDFTRPDVLGKFHIYVSSSLSKAIEEAAPYLANYSDVHRGADAERKERGLLVARDAKTQLTEGFVIAGDPQRCVDTIQRWREAVGLTVISGTFQFGGMPHEMALKNVRLFAERVMPQFR